MIMGTGNGQATNGSNGLYGVDHVGLGVIDD